MNKGAKGGACDSELWFLTLIYVNVEIKNIGYWQTTTPIPRTGSRRTLVPSSPRALRASRRTEDEMRPTRIETQKGMNEGDRLHRTIPDWRKRTWLHGPYWPDWSEGNSLIAFLTWPVTAFSALTSSYLTESSHQFHSSSELPQFALPHRQDN